MAIAFPDIDPVAFSVGPLFHMTLAVRWYSLAYIAGFLGGWVAVRELVKRGNRSGQLPSPTLTQIDDFLFWMVLGVILGGRIGYVLFYNLPFYIDHPSHILKTWEGGMSFHGGLLGVTMAVFLYSRRYKIPLFRLGDLAACGATFGLFFGRLANFVNGELYGRVTDAPWGIIFPQSGDNLPRHPSQLYEAFSEGLLLCLVLNLLAWFRPQLQQRYGFLFGVFLTVYGIARFCIEFLRQPDAQIGLYGGIISQGQVLCLPMIALGLWVINRACHRA